jgi:hypothetical protein
MFDKSHIRALLDIYPRDGYLVGDSGYLCCHYLLTPVINPANAPQRKYNEALYLHETIHSQQMEFSNGVFQRSRMVCD